MENFENERAVAKPMPRNLLVPIVSVLEAVHNISEKRASLPELFDALSDCFDAATMIIYSGSGCGLAEAFDGNAWDGHSGHNKRVDIICELFNQQGWKDEGRNGILASSHERLDAIDFLMAKKDATLLAQRLWMKFFDESRDFQDADFSPNISNNEGVPSEDSDVDPSDLPPELDAANMAFRAVTNGFGDQSATARNRLVIYLKTHYPDFKDEQVQRIATVANPDKSTGRKKAGKE